MRRSTAAVLAVAGLMVTACGASSPSAGSPGPSPLPTSASGVPMMSAPDDVITTAPATTVEIPYAGRPVRADLDRLPINEPADLGCGQESLGAIAYATIAFEGRVTAVSAPAEFDRLHGTVVGRIVEFAIDRHIVDSPQLEPDAATIDVLWPEQYIDDDYGYRYPSKGPDLTQVQALDTALVFAHEPLQDPHHPREIGNVVSQLPEGVSFNGRCQHLEDVADAVAERLGDADAITMLERAAVDGVTSELDAAADAYWAELHAPPDWTELDPMIRVLGPDTVPAELLPVLDVMAVSYALTDLGANQLIGVRTESGVSEPTVSDTALPSLSPLYFLRGDDTSITVFVSNDHSAPVANSTTVATVDLSTVADAGGIEVGGSVTGGVTITPLSRAEVAALLNVDEAGLDEYRMRYLTPTSPRADGS